MPSAFEAPAARLISAGFSGKTVSPELVELVSRGLRSVILFSRNVGEPAEVAELTAAIKRLTPDPFLVAVDQEGGAVQRLRRGFTDLPPMRALGATNDATLAREVGELLGRELKGVGIDWNFAPVLDVDNNPENPVIGARSFSADPALVGRLGSALAAGLESTGVAATGKHFPGHGDTTKDSHLTLPVVTHGLERLDAVELVPFRAAAEAGIASIMTAHIVFSAIDGRFPATLSRAVIDGLLRKKLGYGGIVVSDDLEMQAIAAHFSMEDAVLRALGAGVDHFLVCHESARAHQAIDALIRSAERSTPERDRLETTAARMEAFARRWASPALERFDPSALRTPRHLALAERLGR